jgi:hypothetical protein
MRGKEGYIALLDVLGFEQLVARESYVEELERYTDTIRRASDNSALEFVLFSDTIVITTFATDEGSLKNLVRSCSRLFGELLVEEIPLRGAIAKGSFLRNKTDAGVFLAGRAVVDAYRFEKKQDWVGILLTPSVLKSMPSLRTLCRVPGANLVGADLAREAANLEWMRCIQPCNSVPFHGDIPVEPGGYDGFAIVPTRSDLQTRDQILAENRQMQEALLRLKSLAPDPSAQKKYESTRIWLNSLLSTWARSPAVWHV